MTERNDILHQLSRLLKWKESKAFMAAKLGVTTIELEELLVELKGGQTKPVVRTQPENSADQLLGSKGLGTEYNVAGGWVRTDDMSIRFSKTQERDIQREAFTDFLKTFKPKESVIKSIHNPDAVHTSCLVINIQDAHFNKLDINGHNNIYTRFQKTKARIKQVIVESTATSVLGKIVYVIGSDIFNSEFTDTTTKGTPQQNIMSYQDSFEAIAQHQVDIIELLCENAHTVNVMYCPGNHDEFVGWHLASWLHAYFKNQTNVSFDISPKYTKYVKFCNTAMCFNHGDGAKPEVIAKNFPFAFKDQWSQCEHFYIFGGDKHTELSRDLCGIKFYRIPALSTAQSKWDSKNGYEAKAELTAFLIHEDGGMNIIKRPI